jgi:hypothetical protein
MMCTSPTGYTTYDNRGDKADSRGENGLLWGIQRNGSVNTEEGANEGDECINSDM